MIIAASIAHVLLVAVMDIVGVHCSESMFNTVKLTDGGLAADLAVRRIGDVGDAGSADAEEEGLIGAA